MPGQDQSRRTLRKGSRLLKRADFQHVFDHGQWVGSPCLSARCVRNALGRPRLGFVTPRALGCHAARNRVRRVMREAYRLNQHLLTTGVDVVFMPKRGWTAVRLDTAEPTMQAILRRIEREFAGPA